MSLDENIMQNELYPALTRLQAQRLNICCHRLHLAPVHVHAVCMLTLTADIGRCQYHSTQHSSDSWTIHGTDARVLEHSIALLFGNPFKDLKEPSDTPLRL